MKELSPAEKYWLDYAYDGLNKARSLHKRNRKAAAQEALRESLQASINLPRWFTDTEFEEQYSKLYKQLYSGT